MNLEQSCKVFRSSADNYIMETNRTYKVAFDEIEYDEETGSTEYFPQTATVKAPTAFAAMEIVKASAWGEISIVSAEIA